MQRIAFMVLVAAAAVACADRPTGPNKSVVHFGTPTTFRPGETLLAGAQTITFGEVLSDSRCPIEADCIVDGDAVVRFVIGYANDDIMAPDLIVDLHTSAIGGPDHGAALGYSVTIERLEPVQHAGVTIKPEDYRATVVVQPDAGAAIPF